MVLDYGMTGLWANRENGVPSFRVHGLALQSTRVEDSRRGHTRRFPSPDRERLLKRIQLLLASLGRYAMPRGVDIRQWLSVEMRH